MAATAPNKWLTLIAACLGLGMLMIDTFVVNVALPAIARDLDAGLSSVQWTVSAYVLVLGVLPLTMGRLGDIFGRKLLYLCGLTVFLAGSLLSGLSQSIEQLVAARVLQAAGAGTMMPGTLAIVTNAFPASQRGLAIGIWGGVSGLGLIAGPILGGLLVHDDSWRLVFLVNMPVGAAALLAAARYIPESHDPTVSRRIDVPGLVLLTLGLTGILWAITRGNEQGWTSAVTTGAFGGGVVMLAAFVSVERRVRSPLVDLTLFRNRTFVAACLAAFAFQAGVFGTLPYTSLFMQNYWNFSPIEAGLGIVPSTIIVAMLMPVSGILAQRLGDRLRLVVMAGSLAVLGASLYLLTLDTGSTYLDSFFPTFLLRGLGIGLFMSASSYAVVSSLPMAKAGLASGTLTAVRNIGTATGVALLGAVYVSYVDTEVPARLPQLEGPALVTVVDGVEAFNPAEPVGSPESEASGAIVVDGFVRIMLVSSVVAGGAVGAAFFIRARREEEPELVADVLAAPSRSAAGGR